MHTKWRKFAAPIVLPSWKDPRFTSGRDATFFKRMWQQTSQPERLPDSRLTQLAKASLSIPPHCPEFHILQFFYEEQLHRMECLAHEPVLFEDVLCQMHDMIQPEKEGIFTLADFKRTKPLSGTLFNILFNLNKFVAFETRDPFLVRQASITHPAKAHPPLQEAWPNARICSCLCAIIFCRFIFLQQ